MSGITKGIKKAFKSVGKVLKKIAKPVLIGAAIYFTAGLALSAFPATASFAASLPGFAGGGTLGLGIGASKVAGTGVFSKIAATFGMGGGLAGGALKAGTSATALSGAGFSNAAIATGLNKAGMAGASNLVSSGATQLGIVQSVTGKAVADSATASLVAAGKQVGMSLSDKLLLASTGSKAVGALLGPSETDVVRAQKTFQGAFYGLDSKARAPAAPPVGPGVQPQPGAMPPPAARPKPQGPAATATPAPELISTVQAPTAGGYALPDEGPRTQARLIQ